MSTYLIGDVQGCYRELQQLLEHINYNPDRDQLGFVGDLVNRGPDSLAVLRFLKQQRRAPWIVLGNHDLYLLIIGYGLVPSDAYRHTLHETLQAPDMPEILEWLRHQALVLSLPSHHAVMVHAGLPPQWSSATCLEHAAEITDVLQGPQFKRFLLHLFGNSPASWREDLTGHDRWRYLVNAFTRMRFCDAQGALDFTLDAPSQATDQLKPWYAWRAARSEPTIYFGHWARLQGQSDHPHCIALDTGCAWGNTLTAFHLEDNQRFSVPALNPPSR